MYLGLPCILLNRLQNTKIRLLIGKKEAGQCFSSSSFTALAPVHFRQQFEFVFKAMQCLKKSSSRIYFGSSPGLSDDEATEVISNIIFKDSKSHLKSKGIVPSLLLHPASGISCLWILDVVLHGVLLNHV